MFGAQVGVVAWKSCLCVFMQSSDLVSIYSTSK